MRLLVFTQAVDSKDPLLGFMQSWLIGLATHFEHVHVICLKVGEYQLPSNVSVYSLGKERGVSRTKYCLRFYKYLIRLHGTYDRVFVHMNPHYVILGGLYWSFVRIPIFFWRNHARMNWMTQVAARFAKRIFYTSPYACTSRYPHALQMPVGINCDLFSLGTREAHAKPKLLFLGRISPVKRVDLFLRAARIIGDRYEIHVYGDAPLHDRRYGERMRSEASENVMFHTSVSNDQTPEVYRSHDVYVNLTPEGSMDKTVLEAAACGIPVIAANPSFVGILPREQILKDPTPEAIVDAIDAVLKKSEGERVREAASIRSIITAEHSLQRLVQKLSIEMA